jgi:hypothetical protein
VAFVFPTCRFAPAHLGILAIEKHDRDIAMTSREDVGLNDDLLTDDPFDAKLPAVDFGGDALYDRTFSPLSYHYFPILPHYFDMARALQICK